MNSSETRPNTEKKRGLFFFLTIFLPVLFALLLAEIYIRFFSPVGFLTPATMRLQAKGLETVPALFSKNIFPQKTQSVHWDKDTVIPINSKGYRGAEFEIKKPAGMIRIIVYGGSVVLDGYHDWPHQVETLLKQRGFPNVEVINAGVVGHSAFDAFGRFFAEGHLFEPDYVILYSGWNDLKFFANAKPLLRQFKPEQRRDPLLHYHGWWDRRLCELSQLYVRLRYRYIAWKFHAGPEGAQPDKHSSEISATALRQYRLTLETFVDMARNAHAVPLLIPEARLLAPQNTENEREMINYASQTLTPEAIWPATVKMEEIIHTVAHEKSADVIDTASMDGNTLYLMDNSHLTTEGAQKLAEITADALEQLLRRRTAGAPSQESNESL